MKLSMYNDKKVDIQTNSYNMGIRDIGAWVKDLDIFGHPVTVFYKGNDSYKTKLGILCTLGVWFLTFSYALIQLTELMVMEEPDVLVFTKTLTGPQKELPDFVPLNLNDKLVDVGFVFIKEFLSPVHVDLPRKVGHLSVFVDDKEIAELVPCKDEINSKQKE